MYVASFSYSLRIARLTILSTYDYSIAICIGNVAAIIVSLPHESYVLQGNRGTIRCQNRSADERVFYSYITNAVWYRDYENGTEKRIGTSGSVYSSRHLLNFIPTVKKVDEGVYYCCVPNGPCGNSITSRTVVKISSKLLYFRRGSDTLWKRVRVIHEFDL